MIPKKVFFTKGVGVHREKLASFETALRQAGIEKCNLVTVSSILPPHVKLISKAHGIKLLKPGQIVFNVMARNATNEPHRLIVSAVGVAVPAEKASYGYLSEHHGFGETAKKAGDYAEDIAATLLASTLGIDLDPDKAWDERKQFYKSSGHIFRTDNVCQSARGHKDGLWTTVIASAVFLLE